MTTNWLYYGDNLDILRHKVPTASVDLVYLDPPFNSNADYNVIFREQSGEKSAAQIKAFTDTWHWDQDTDRAREEILTEAPENVAKMLDAVVSFIGRNDLTAYLVMMTQRLVELHRVLKPTGSLYLHCDPTASHYLKIVLDAIFGPERFLNEITWRRTHSHGNVGRNFGSICDIILVYTKGSTYTWNQVYTAFAREYVEGIFDHQDSSGRRWQSVTLRNPGLRPNLHFPYTASNGVTYQPHPNGWSCDLERLQKYDREGRLHFPSKPTGALRLKMYLDESPGIKLQNLWDDIPALASKSSERMGYPTQKPLSLLERIISTSSNPGDVVLDPFCGCGTAICAAQKLERHWIGIDITHLAVSLMKSRLKSMFGLEPNKDYRVEGEPTDVASARQLALDDRYQFQYWAVSLVEATAQEQKKGADKGIDGVIAFIDGSNRHRERIIVQVKSGHVTSSHIRDLKGVLEREKAAMGLYICLENPTKDMKDEANSAGFYRSQLWSGAHGDHKWPRIQIRTVGELLAGNGFELPPRPVQFRQAGRVASDQGLSTGELWTVGSTAWDGDESADDEDELGADAI